MAEENRCSNSSSRKSIRRTLKGTNMRRGGTSWSWWLLVTGTVLAVVLLSNTGHGAVIKRENSVNEQELAAEELLAAAEEVATPAPSAANRRLDTLTATNDGKKDNDAIRDANRISELATDEGKTLLMDSQKTKENGTSSKLGAEAAAEMLAQDDGDDDAEEGEDVTGEPFDAADGSATDAPIPTFPPFDINRYTSSYRDDGVAESESLRGESSGGGGYTTVDYEQRFDRIELTTPTPMSSAEMGPSSMFKQEASRFDANGMRMEDEGSLENTNNDEDHEAATVVNLDAIKENSTAERNSSAYFNNIELETTKYETRADETKAEGANQTAAVGKGEKRGKYLQNAEEATIINSDSNGPNLSIPSTADVWALATMKNVEHTKKKAGFYYNETVDRNGEKDSVNGTSATKLLTDWMEIMKNNEFSNGSFLGNDIPSVAERPSAGELREENKVIEVAVAPPTRIRSTTSARRFDESVDTTTEVNYYHSTDLDFPTGSGKVSDNLYYEDFTTDLPDYLTTTPAEPELEFRPVNSGPTATTQVIPGNELNTVPTEQHFDRKPSAELNNVEAPLESTSVHENYIPSTATEEENRNNGFLQSPTTPAEVTVTANGDGGDEEEQPLPPRIIPLVDSAIIATTEKKELEQHRPEVEEDKEQQQIVPQTTLSSTDITNNSIETKVVESNNLPEYTLVEHTSTGIDGGVGVSGGDATTNNNGNYLETVNGSSNYNNSPTGAAAAHDDHEDGHGQYTRPEYPMTESSRVEVPVSGGGGGVVVGTTTVAAGHESVVGESGANEQSVAGGSETMTTTTSAAVHLKTTTAAVSSSSTAADQAAATNPPPETMATKTKALFTTTMSPEQIDLEQRRTNGHQVVDGRHNLDGNNTLELGSVAAGGVGGEATEPTGGRDVNAIIAITVSVVAVIALVLLVGFLYVMRKRQKQLSYGQRCQPVGLDAYSLDNVSVYNSVRRKNNNLRLSKRSYGNSAFEDPGLKFNNLSIQGLQTMINNKDEIYEEFKEIPLITARVDEVPAGCEDKNRYANVVPLPETRVHLKQLNGDEKTEYINANYVRGPKDNVNYYIACQAPMENTIVDFWRMIWEQNSKVICMLTDLTENGIEKCAEYLPPSAVLDTNRVFGDFSVTLKNREVKDKYAVSTIHLRNTETNTWREITHFWYQWPEEGMPLDETSVIAMLLEVRSYLKMAMPEQTGNSDDEVLTQDEKQKKIQELNDDLTEKLEEDSAATEKKADETATTTTTVVDKSKSLQRSQGPLTVHCSPGTGRTGTIIGCDIALRSLEMKNRSVDVPQTVYYVRRGRASSIKTRDQYEFIYRCANTYALKLMEPIAEN